MAARISRKSQKDKSMKFLPGNLVYIRDNGSYVGYYKGAIMLILEQQEEQPCLLDDIMQQQPNLKGSIYPATYTVLIGETKQCVQMSIIDEHGELLNETSTTI